MARLTRGREFEETVDLLKRVNTSVIIAGDVYVEDHLKYMERVASEAGASLREPLWGRDPEELVYGIVEAGVEALVIGCEKGLEGWLGRVLGRESVETFVAEAKRLGYDPLGERGEYHTLVVRSPLHTSRLRYSVVGVSVEAGYWLLHLS